MTPRLKSLVLWERPTVSAGVLGASLALVLSCRWVSLLNLTCAALVFGTAASFAYVNGLLAFNRLTNKADAPRPLAYVPFNCLQFVSFCHHTSSLSINASCCVIVCHGV